MDTEFDLNQLTITNRYGYAIIEDAVSGRALVCEPTMAGDNVIAFVIIDRCEDRLEALGMAVALHDLGVTPTDWRGGNDDREQDPSAQQIEAEAAPAVAADIDVAAAEDAAAAH